MSYDEQIQQLESEKRTCMERYDKQINDLWIQKQEAEDPDHKNGDTKYVNGRPLLVLRGKPLSQRIVDARGGY